MLSVEEVRMKAGFPIDIYLKEIKKDLKIHYPLRLYFDRYSTPQAMAQRTWDGKVGEIHLPTDRVIHKYMPSLSANIRQAKMVSQIAEEAAHWKCHETSHDTCVVSKTV